MLVLIKSLFDLQQWVSNPSEAKFGQALYKCYILHVSSETKQ